MQRPPSGSQRGWRAVGLGTSVVRGTGTGRDGPAAVTAQRQQLPRRGGGGGGGTSALLRRGDGPTPRRAAPTLRAAYGRARPRSGLPPRRDNGRHGRSAATELCRRPRAPGRAQMATQHGRFSACAAAALSGLSLPSDTVLLWLLLCFCFCTLPKISAETRSGAGAASLWGTRAAQRSAGAALGVPFPSAQRDDVGDGGRSAGGGGSPSGCIPAAEVGSALQLPRLPSAPLWPRGDRGWRLKGMVQHGPAWHSMAKHGIAWHSMARYGIAEQSTAQHRTAQQGTVQSLKAQHSTEQLSTAHHSVAQ